MINNIIENLQEYWKPLIISLVILFLLYLLSRMLLKGIDRNLRHRYKEWKSFLYDHTRQYLKLFFSVIGLWILLITLKKNVLPEPRRDLFYKIVFILLIIVFSLLISKVIAQFKNLWLLRLEDPTVEVSYDKSDIYTLFYFLNILLWIFTFFIILASLHVSLGSLATFGGAGAIAVSFIFKNSFENIVGGIFLHLDRPFVVGESIYTVDSKIEGAVEKIGWRLTVIRQSDQRPVYVPNATFVSSAVVNTSRMSNRCIKQYIGIRYYDMPKILQLMEKIREYLLSHEGIDMTKSVLVSLADGSEAGGAFGSYQVTMAIVAFSKTVEVSEFKKLQDEVMLHVGKLIHEAGADIAVAPMSLPVVKPGK